MDCGVVASRRDRWEAKKARAMQRRRDAATVLAEPALRRSWSACRITQPPGGASSLSFGAPELSEGASSLTRAASAGYHHITSRRDASPRAVSAGYRDELAAQIAERRAARDADRLRKFQLDVADDARVQRQADELRREVEAEIAAQRQREATVANRADALHRYLNQEQPQSDGRRGVSSNVWASGANQNCGNFITSRPTSRVLNPPGGKTSYVFG